MRKNTSIQKDRYMIIWGRGRDQNPFYQILQETKHKVFLLISDIYFYRYKYIFHLYNIHLFFTLSENKFTTKHQKNLYFLSKEIFLINCLRFFFEKYLLSPLFLFLTPFVISKINQQLLLGSLHTGHSVVHHSCALVFSIVLNCTLSHLCQWDAAVADRNQPLPLVAMLCGVDALTWATFSCAIEKPFQCSQ